MDLPRISVVTPSFNQAAFLERTLQSVLSQGYPALEYLVLDGGSTDGSAGLLRSYADRLAFVRSAPDGGQAAALREGFERSTGDVQCWINSDDVFEPGALRFVGEVFAARPDIDFIYGSVRNIDVNDRRLFTSHTVLGLPTLSYESSFTPQQAMFWRRGLYEKAGGIDASYRFAMDFDLLVRMVLAGARPLKVRRVLGSIRVHGAAKSSSMQHICAEEVQRTLARHGLVHGGPLARFLKCWGLRAYRFARDPRCLYAAVESRLKGVGPQSAKAHAQRAAGP